VARVWKGLKADKDGPLGNATFQTGQETIDIGADVEWFQRFRVPSDRVPVLVNQELFEIPPNICGMEWIVEVALGAAELLPGRFAPRLEKRVDGILCLPVHFCLREHVEVRDEATARPNMLQRGEDFAGIRPWLLEDTRHGIIEEVE